MSLILIGVLISVVELPDDEDVVFAAAAFRSRGSLSCLGVRVVIVGAVLGIFSGVIGVLNLNDPEEEDDDEECALGVGILGAQIEFVKGFAIGVPRFGREVDNAL